MDSELLERSIVREINNLGIASSPFPVSPKNYFPQAYPGEVLVRYDSAKFGKDSVGSVTNGMTAKIELLFVSQELRGDNGLLGWLSKVRHRLVGYTPVDIGGFLEIVSESFNDEVDGTWYYVQTWTLNAIINYEQRDEYADCTLGP